MIRIKNWDDVFENADTRKRQRLGWYLQPSGCDSSGYVELMSHGPDGVTAYGVFVAICQWSATCCRDVRGTCRRSDRRCMSRRQIAAVIRMPAEVVEASISLLLDPDIGWLIEDADETGQNTSEITKSASNLPGPAGDLPDAADHFPALLKEKEKEKEKSPPADLIASEFNRVLGLSCRMTDKRQTQLKARWKDPHFREHWQLALERAGPSEFLRGENDRGWRMDLEWFLKPDSMTNILEGKYDNRKTKVPSGGQSRFDREKQQLEEMLGDLAGEAE